MGWPAKRTVPEVVEIVAKVVKEMGDWDSNMRDPMHPIDVSAHLTNVVEVVCATLACLDEPH